MNLYNENVHLFVDDDEVLQMYEVNRYMEVPRRLSQPIISPEKAWEGSIRIYGSVLQDDSTGKLKMWYSSFGDGREKPFRSLLCYAESEDGIRWSKPSLGLYEFEGSKDNNIVLPDYALYPYHLDGFDGISILRDNNEQDANKTYKLVAWMYNSRAWKNLIEKEDLPEEEIQRYRQFFGFYMLTSPDGIHWDSSPEKILDDGGDRNHVAYDYRKGVFMQTGRPRTDQVEGVSGPRMVAIRESSDLKHWSSFRKVFTLGEADHFGKLSQHLSVYPFNYGNQYLGFLEVANMKNGGGQLFLASSRDGVRWEKILHETPFFPLGGYGDWDSKMINFSTNPPIRIKDDLYLYYDARHSKGSDIGLAILPADRFVGIRAGSIKSFASKHEFDGGGFVTTTAVKAGGPELYINSRGYIKVEIRDATNKPLSGYGIDDCHAIQTDSVRNKVTWRDKENVEEFVGKDISLHIKIRGGSVYSYFFE